ncbi:FAD-binding domain-containing protein [Zopfia rhizophila CBS 207.26]|uniref:FAD-binding domain-containing protein n=1 Tax=Zopfia rhizophila CBS 207.26 TaxID=1314779 RepID=A0A6A6DCU4_9PEZI|nr:FAD-binding domain-containing protein [Zopfia rhizophila CBS 207.26]
MHPSTSYLLSWIILGAVVASSDTTTSTCDALSSVLSDVFFPESDIYNASISSYPFIQLRLHPTCIVRPKTSQDVSIAVNVLRESGCTKFAVRGGGHNANAGFNNIEDGVTIDMQSMNAVDVDKEVVRVGAGAIWQDVYDVVEPRNLSVLGGRIGVVGVAGLTTGGGISFFSPERGWVCDSVVNFQVVLASGDIVDVNATSRPDLFAGLKGGQNNFGIVTRFDLKAFPQGPIWGGRIAFAPEADTALVSAFTEFKNPHKYDPYAAGWVTLRYNGSTKQFTPTSILWYTRPELKPGALAQMTEVGPQVMNGMQEAYAGEFTRNASLVVKSASSRTIWATTTFHISPTIVHHIHSLWKSLVPKICETYAYARPTSELTFQSLPPSPQNGSHPNSLGFAPDSTPEKDLVFLQIIFYFWDASATEGLNNALKEFIKMFNEIAEEEGVKHKYIYLNFAAWFQDPLGGYGKEQVETLRHVARKYDPEGLFQEQVVGGFKLF